MMLQGKVALVTGSASGIGRATATLAVSAEQRAFGAAGAKVVFSDIRDVEGEETAALVRETGAECLFVKSDVSSEADVQALVQKTTLAVSAKQRATYGKLDCAFNNAGIDLVVTPLHEQSIEDFDQIMSVNARGLFLCMKYREIDANPGRRRARGFLPSRYWGKCKVSGIRRWTRSQAMASQSRKLYVLLANRAPNKH